MNLKAVEGFYLAQQEPAKSCFLAMRIVLLQFDDEITEEWKYNLPFFYYRNRPFVYFWKNAKTGNPYIGFTKGIWMNHGALEQGNRTRMKILQIDAEEDLPILLIQDLLKMAKDLY